jgi:peptidoglycan/LPS O-acetylase OafA/YrhL
MASPVLASENLSPVPAAIPKDNLEHKRLLGLDILRFVAVTLVVCRHLVVKGDSWLSGILNVAHTGGSIGVDVFFVLSGFLVSGLLFREYQKNGNIKLGRFLIRRGWKIYPPLWTLVAFSLLIWDFGWWDGFSRRGLIAETLFLQNYIGGLWFNTWSLGVEEHFYFLLAGLVLFLLHFRSKNHRHQARPFSFIPVIFVVIAGICLAARIIRSHHMTANFYFYASDCRIDELMFGVLLSYGWHFSENDRFRDLACRWRVSFLALGILCMAPAFIWPIEKFTWVPVFQGMLVSLGAGMLILGVLSFSNLERIPLMKSVGKLGTYSYSAYLWHGPFVVLGLGWCQVHFGSHWKDWIEFLVSFSCTWLLGIVAARLVEIPVLHVRERYFPVHVPNLK